jgi:hypothetical protein
MAWGPVVRPVPAKSDASRSSGDIGERGVAGGGVFGDIGTSPLYTWSEIRAHGGLSDPADVLGVCSLIVWTLTLVVAVKYVLIVLRADNHGEGPQNPKTPLV